MKSFRDMLDEANPTITEAIQIQFIQKYENRVKIFKAISKIVNFKEFKDNPYIIVDGKIPASRDTIYIYFKKMNNGLSDYIHEICNNKGFSYAFSGRNSDIKGDDYPFLLRIENK